MEELQQIPIQAIQKLLESEAFEDKENESEESDVFDTASESEDSPPVYSVETPSDEETVFKVKKRKVECQKAVPKVKIVEETDVEAPILCGRWNVQHLFKLKNKMKVHINTLCEEMGLRTETEDEEEPKGDGEEEYFDLVAGDDPREEGEREGPACKACEEKSKQAEALKKENDKLEEKLKHKEMLLFEKQITIEEASKTTGKQVEEIKVLQSEIQVLSDETNTKINQILNLTNILSSVETERMRLSWELEKENRKRGVLEKEIDGLKATAAENNKNPVTEDFYEAVDHLVEIHNLKKKISNLETEAEGLRNKNKADGEIILGYTNSLRAAQAHISSLETKLADQKGMLKMEKRKHEKFQKEAEGLRNKNKADGETILGYTNSLRVAQAHIASLETKLADQKGMLEMEKRKHEKFQKEAEDLRNKHNADGARILGYTTSLKEAQEQIASLETKLAN